MPLPADINIDLVLSAALVDIMGAVEGWLQGAPTDEVALMNRLTEKLSRRRRGCDVGCRSPIIMTAQTALLHRRGSGQTDQYGSDLAVTVGAHDCAFLKTCVFQLKKSSDYQATLERTQLNGAVMDPVIAPRSFVAAFDEARPGGMRLRSTQDLLGTFDPRQASKQFDTEAWSSFSEWFMAWISCNVGPLSQRDDPNSVEPLLESYRMKPPYGDEWVSPWGYPRSGQRSDEIVPARAWTALFFNKKMLSEPLLR